MRRRADWCIAGILKGVGDTRERYVEFSDACIHYRRPLTDREAAGLVRENS